MATERTAAYGAHVNPWLDRHRGDVRHLHGGARHHRGQRVAAAHRRQPVGDDRRGHLGAHVLPRRQRDHPADDRLAGERSSAASGCSSLSIVGFTAASLLCGLAPNLPMLVLFRIIQGATGGAMQPLSQAVLLEAFPPHERGKAMGFWGLGIVVAPILGPVLGGWLTDNYSLALGLLHQHPGRHRCRSCMTQAVHLRPALPQARDGDRSTTGASACSRSASARCRSCSTRARRTTGSRRRFIIVLAVVAAVGGSSRSSSHELIAEDPIVDLRVFRDRTLRDRRVPDDGRSASCCTAAWCCCRSCCRRCSATRRCRPASRWRRAASGSFIGDADRRHPHRRSSTRGSCSPSASRSAAVTLLWLGHAQPAGRLLGLLLAAVHAGRRAGAAVRAAHHGRDGRDLRASEMGNATSLFNLMRNIGGSIGIAVTGTMLARQQQMHGDVLGAHVTVYSPATRDARLAARRVHGRGSRTRTRRRDAPTRPCSAWCSGRRRWCRSSSSSACSASSSCCSCRSCCS